MKGKARFIFALLLISSMVLSACAQATEAPPAAEPPAAATEPPAEEPVVEEPVVEEPVVEEPTAPQGEPIKIGASLPLTGSFSIPGSKHGDGYQLCVDLINDGGGLLGRPVELIISDNQSDAETIMTQFERFINVDRVDLIFGTFSSLLTFPASALTEQAELVHPNPSGAALRIFERGFDYMFYFQPNAAEYIGKTPVELIENLVPDGEKPETVALVYADDFFANGIAAGLMGEEITVAGTDRVVSLAPGGFAEIGLEVVYKEQWPEQGFSDWLTLANSIKTANADVLFALVTSPDEGIQLIRALQTIDYQPKGIYMSQGSQSEFLDELGTAVNGLLTHASWHPLANFTGKLNGEDFTNEMFLAAFREKYGREADEDEAIPFSLCQGMEQAVRATNSTDNKVLREWMIARTAEEPVSTILGDFYWDERGLPVDKPFIMVQWQNEELKFVYPQDAFPGIVDLVWPKPEW
jgi:branched-chain amino acid transport system substrate-binding protein